MDNMTDYIEGTAFATFTFGCDYTNRDKVRAILKDAMRRRSDLR